MHLLEDYQFRYRETVNGNVLPWTPLTRCNTDNARLVSGKIYIILWGKFINIGDMEISIYNNPDIEPVYNSQPLFPQTPAVDLLIVDDENDLLKFKL